MTVLSPSNRANRHLPRPSREWPSYSNIELEDIEEEVALLAHDLSAKIEDEIIPPKN